MPITPLHFGLLPAVEKVTTRKVSHIGFILANLVTDIPVVWAIMYSDFMAKSGENFHGTLHGTPTHTFLGALFVGLFIGVWNLKSPGWMVGCLLGSLTHVGLDMFCHDDVAPFWPLTHANPFYFEWGHALLSVALTVGLAVLLLQYMHRIKFAVVAWRAARKKARSESAA